MRADLLKPDLSGPLYLELVSESPSTATWFMPERTGLQAADQRAFELLEFSVNGDVCPIRRSQRKTGQTYSATIPDEHLGEGVPVRLRHVYRTVGAKDAHRVFVKIPVPARNVTLSIDYTDADIATVVVTDLVSGTAKPRVSRSPEQLPGRQLSVELPGWLLPRSGFTFVWTLSSETTADSAARPTRTTRAA